MRLRVRFALSAFLSVNLAYAPSSSTTSSGGSSSNSSGGSGALTAGGPSIPQPTIATQTNSVEGDLLAFKALQSDGQAIGLDVAPLAAGKKVLILAPADPSLTNFQLWRAARLSMNQLTAKATSITPKPSPAGGAKSFLATETAISSTLALIQTIGSFFTNNETSLGLAGSPQDQALQDGIARVLRVKGIEVSIPGLYPPFAFTALNANQSLFLHDLKALEDARTDLGDAVTQKTQWDADGATIIDDHKQIATLQAQDDASVKDHKAPVNTETIKKLKDDIATHQVSQKKLSDGFVDDGLKNLNTANATALLQTIDAFLSSLLNAGTSTPAASTPAATATSASGSTPSAPAPSSTATAPPSSSTTVTNPPIINLLYADGFAAMIGFSVSKPTPSLDDWLVLMVKSIEVAPTIYAKSNFWSTKVEFAGGSTATMRCSTFPDRCYARG